MKLYGQLEKADLENLAAAPSSPSRGRVYYDTALGIARVYNGSTWNSFLAPDSSKEISNLSLACSVGSSALTISLKDKAGATPSTDSVVAVGMRSSTAATGTYSRRTVTGALSLVIDSGSTLGHASAIASYIYVYLIDNAGTLELAASTTLWDEGSRVSTTAVGSTGVADSNATMYSTTARTNVACRVIGRLDSNQVTAGAWAAVPTEISLVPFKQPGLMAYYTSAAGQSITNNTIETVVFGTKVIDRMNMVNTSTGAITLPSAGQYAFIANTNWTAGALGTRRTYMYQNGASVVLQGLLPNASTDNGGGLSGFINGAAGDACALRVFQNSGGALALLAAADSVNFAIWKL